MVQIEHEMDMVIGMGNCQIRFTETFNVFRLFKGYMTIWEGSNILKLYSEVVSFFQTFTEYSFKSLDPSQIVVKPLKVKKYRKFL